MRATNKAKPMAKFVITHRCRFAAPGANEARHWDRGEEVELNLDVPDDCILAAQLNFAERIRLADDPEAKQARRERK